MSFIGLNRYKISLFFLTWRRQLAAKRMSWMRGPAGVAGGGWFAFSLYLRRSGLALGFLPQIKFEF